MASDVIDAVNRERIARSRRQRLSLAVRRALHRLQDVITERESIVGVVGDGILVGVLVVLAMAIVVVGCAPFIHGAR
jgi:hypothetical protein